MTAEGLVCRPKLKIATFKVENLNKKKTHAQNEKESLKARREAKIVNFVIV